MLKRILNFDKDDWLHIQFLLKNMIKQLSEFNFTEARESVMWIKIHLTYNSNKHKGD